MDNNKTFLDELLEQAEAKEITLHLAHVDLVLAEISNLEEQILKNFEQTEHEKKILDEWTIRKNSKLQDRISWMTMKLESFMKSQGDSVKTIDLPNGKLLRRKQPDKIEIADIDKFMLRADSQLLTVIPEMVKPNLKKIMAYYKRRLILPEGTKLIIGEEKFSIKLNNNDKEKDDGESSEIRTGDQQADSYKPFFG